MNFTWEVLAESGAVIGTVQAKSRRSAAASMRRMFYTGVRVRLADEEAPEREKWKKGRLQRGRFWPIVTSHHLNSEGGRKTHVEDRRTGRSLCGIPERFELFCNTLEPIEDVRRWLDTDGCGELCQKCRNALLALLKDRKP